MIFTGQRYVLIIERAFRFVSCIITFVPKPAKRQGGA